VIKVITSLPLLFKGRGQGKGSEIQKRKKSSFETASIIVTKECIAEKGGKNE